MKPEHLDNNSNETTLPTGMSLLELKQQVLSVNAEKRNREKVHCGFIPKDQVIVVEKWPEL